MDEMKELLLKSLDAKLDEYESKKLETALEESEVLRTYLQDIMEMRTQLKALKQEYLNESFTDQIMDHIDDKKKNQSIAVYSMERVFKRIAYTAAATLLFMFAYNAYTSDEINMKTIVGLKQTTFDQDFEEAIAYID